MPRRWRKPLSQPIDLDTVYKVYTLLLMDIISRPSPKRWPGWLLPAVGGIVSLSLAAGWIYIIVHFVRKFW